MSGPGSASLRRSADALAEINDRIINCSRCPRLVWWREEAAKSPPARFRDESYWARPVPGFGDPGAKVMIVGLAPAAHGGNRTGRIFTGDRSGEFLFPVLYSTGFANQPIGTHVGDGMQLIDLYVGAVNRCAPPDNKPTPEERDNCLPFLVEEMRALSKMRVIVCLGGFAWDGVLRTLATLDHPVRPRPAFAHLAEARVDQYTLLGSYHPSQQNTFTGRLTPQMLTEVFTRARQLAGLPERYR